MASLKFHVDNDVIITTTDRIDVEEVFNHLKKRLHDFKEKSQFITICGYHTAETGEIGAIDDDLLYDFQCLFQRFHDNQRYSKEAKIRQKKQFQMGSVIPVNTIRDWSQKEKKIYSLSDQTKDQIRITFENALSNEVPIVLILASCYSYMSEIFHILRSCGLSSAINLLQERGNITCGKFFKLDKVQKEVLRVAVMDETKKDYIIGGEF